MGANINQKAKHEVTPLHSAIQFNQIEIAQTLINLGADIECQQVIKETPLIFAARRGNSSMCEILIGKGANKDA